MHNFEPTVTGTPKVALETIAATAGSHGYTILQVYDGVEIAVWKNTDGRRFRMRSRNKTPAGVWEYYEVYPQPAYSGKGFLLKMVEGMLTALERAKSHLKEDAIKTPLAFLVYAERERRAVGRPVDLGSTDPDDPREGMLQLANELELELLGCCAFYYEFVRVSYTISRHTFLHRGDMGPEIADLEDVKKVFNPHQIERLIWEAIAPRYEDAVK